MSTRASGDASRQVSSTRWQSLSRATGVAGLATFVLLFVPILIRSADEPDFEGSAAEVIAYFESVDSAFFDFLGFVATVGIVGLLWFAAGLSRLLGRVEGEPHWRSTVALVSAVVVVPLVLVGSWDAAIHRADDIEPQVARYAFDVGNFAFTNAWVAMGSFGLAAGWIMVSEGFLPRWLGWLAVASGAGLVLVRAVRLSEIWFLPYGLFWLWVVIVSILLIRRAAAVAQELAR